MSNVIGDDYECWRIRRHPNTFRFNTLTTGDTIPEDSHISTYDTLDERRRPNPRHKDGKIVIPTVIEIISGKTNTTYRIATYGNNIFTVEKNNTFVKEELEKESRWNILIETHFLNPTIFTTYAKAKEYLSVCLGTCDMVPQAWTAMRVKGDATYKDLFK